jgi:hypothetical protein
MISWFSSSGIALLNTYCKKEIHVQHPAVDTNHMVGIIIEMMVSFFFDI